MKKEYFKDWRRFWGAIIYLVAGIGLIVVFCIRGDLFYREEEFQKSFWNYPRYFWCLAWGFIGFFLTALESSREDRKQGSCEIAYAYYIKYLIGIAICAALIFVFFNERESTRGALFYYGGASVTFLAGYFIYPIMIGFQGLIKKYGESDPDKPSQPCKEANAGSSPDR